MPAQPDKFIEFEILHKDDSHCGEYFFEILTIY